MSERNHRLTGRIAIYDGAADTVVWRVTAGPEDGLGSRAYPGRENHRSAARAVARRLNKVLGRKTEG